MSGPSSPPPVPRPIAWALSTLLDERGVGSFWPSSQSCTRRWRSCTACPRPTDDTFGSSESTLHRPFNRPAAQQRWSPGP